MKKLITSIAGAILSVFSFFETWTKRRAEKEIVRNRKQTIDRVNEARNSIVKGDEETLNRILEDKRLENSVKNTGAAHIVNLVFILACFVILCSFSMLAGCITRTRTIVVPADRHVTRMELDGVWGWFVPDATMADLVENYVKTQELDEGQQNEETME